MTYICIMPDCRIVKANPHAIPLMLDMVDSTNYLPGGDRLAESFAERLAAVSATLSSFGSAEYFLGFEDHYPFGFAGFAAIDDCAELIGPFLYRDYLGKGLGVFLLNQICDTVRLRELRLLFALIPSEASQAEGFLIRSGFETVSADPEFIKRWRDGLLAEIRLEERVVLLARLISLDA